jgi:DNA polymerase-3 subunit alpha (Gram-positive type)
MAICLSCGAETEGCLCEACKQKINIEELCEKIRIYTPCIIDNPNVNPIWEKVASEMEQSYNFKNMAFAVADFLPSPRKEYQQIICMVGTKLRVPRASKPWFYEAYEQIISIDGLEKEEKLRLKGLMLEALYQDYRYPEADELASELLERSPLPWQTIYVIAEFFSQTRRYDEADDAISVGNKLNAGNYRVLRQYAELAEKNEKRRTAADTGKQEYFPSTKNDPLALQKYTEFMASLGIDVKVSSTRFSSGGKTPRYPTPIPKGEYPDPIEKREADFDSFVAFDFETTGKFPGTDAIIEVGAVRVVNGQIVESAEFTFQEFVKPFKKSLPAAITELTGITKEELKDARQMWEVIPDFMRFVGDDIMVGYNSVGFDAKFLCRAGRYSNEIYTNKHFDVLRYAKELKDTIGYTGVNFKLVTVGEFLRIENTEAHRALADAITTARIYLKLKEMSGGVSTQSSADSVLDLGDW